MKNEADIIESIQKDQWMMETLKVARTLDLPDWWVCAGFVRSKIWDTLHEFTKRTEIPDVDIIYFDQYNPSEVHEKLLEARLNELHPHVPWSVKNQARMHVINKIPPYTSSVDAISKFPETATALGVKINDVDEVVLAAPCGIDDVLQLKLRPTTYFQETDDRKYIYQKRIGQKNWKASWPRITVQHITEKQS
ncbi:nucleotidyltransferase family protein [Alkalihalobacillus sp. AL-G]|uniref:nucleotidyltransferase family protein n=1 Tax=Alkalihalobacillus sp. AL-G TaxID=2926399 RepID=UPI00272AF81B|nr:nucleotidyltransferase family protein [Alkalihalobacillus sp. AL-G]WLD94756.1 nucleotidyltransferase family protein [Alkalihalobacillus sp. AL-G]